MLQIVVDRSMDSALLRCSGRLVAGEEVLRLRETVMCQADKRSVQLDFAGVETIDAAGLGLLVSLHTLGRVFGFELQLRNPVRRVRALLKLTGLQLVLLIQPPTEVESQLSVGASRDDSCAGNFKGRTNPFPGPRAPVDPLPGTGSEIARSQWKWVSDA